MTPDQWDSGEEALLGHQIEYYRRRAPEYDDWFYRRGRYDHGAGSNSRWWSEVAEVDRALCDLGDLGSVLELAAGTGVWTEKLARQASAVTAVDSSPETLAINRSKLALSTTPVDYVVADLFTWDPVRRFDTVFFGFWLSHVPGGRFEAFWNLVHRCLAPDGRVFLVDSQLADESGAKNHTPPNVRGERAKRVLNDASEFEIVKVFYSPDALAQRVSALGWHGEFRATRTFFIFGTASRA